MVEVITRTEAKARGLVRYFSGRPCKRGHLSHRYVVGQYCCECRNEWELSDEGRKIIRKRQAKDYVRRRSTTQGVEKQREANQRSWLRHKDDEATKERRLRYFMEYCRRPEYKKKNRIKKLRSYGLTLEQFDEIAAAQNFVCAACGEPERHGLRVDHCHKTGKVRGLLCINCNIGLGNFKDDISRLEKAIAYLRSQRGR